MNEKLKNLTEEQMNELAAKTTPEDVIAYLKSIGVELTEDEIAQLSEVPDDALEGAAGGTLSELIFRGKPKAMACHSCGHREVINVSIVNPGICPKCSFLMISEKNL